MFDKKGAIMDAVCVDAFQFERILKSDEQLLCINHNFQFLHTLPTIQSHNKMLQVIVTSIGPC